MSTKEKTIIIVSSLFVGGLMLIGLAIAMYNVGANLDTKTTVRSETPTVSKDTEYRGDQEITLKSDNYEDVYSGAKTQFIEACIGEGVTVSECGCMYDYLDDNLTNKEFTEYIKTVTEDNVGEIGMNAINSCKGQ